MGEAISYAALAALQLHTITSKMQNVQPSIWQILNSSSTGCSTKWLGMPNEFIFDV